MIKYGWKRLVIVPSWARSLSLCRFTFRLPKFILFLSPFVSALFQHLLLLSFNRVNLYPWNDFLFFCLNCFLFCISWFLLLFILSPTSLFKMPLCQCSPSPLRPPALSLVQPGSACSFRSWALASVVPMSDTTWCRSSQKLTFEIQRTVVVGFGHWELWARDAEFVWNSFISFPLYLVSIGINHTSFC